LLQQIQVESSGDFPLALHDALIIRDVLQYLHLHYPLFCANQTFNCRVLTPLMNCFILQADGLNQTQFCFPPVHI